MLLQHALSSELSTTHANQLRQVGFSLDLEPAASRARSALPEEVLRALRSEEAVGDAWRCGDDEILQEICEMVTDRGHKFDVASSVANFYTVDLLLKLDGSSRGIVLESAANASASMPHDPWMILKLRHLPLLGCQAAWLPTRRWREWDSDERQTFITDLVTHD